MRPLEAGLGQQPGPGTVVVKPLGLTILAKNPQLRVADEESEKLPYPREEAFHFT